jgi:hypothetical protein
MFLLFGYGHEALPKLGECLGVIVLAGRIPTRKLCAARALSFTCSEATHLRRLTCHSPLSLRRISIASASLSSESPYSLSSSAR